MTRFHASSIATGLALVLAIACGGDDKNSIVATGTDAGPDSGTSGGTGNGGASNGGNSNGGNSNGGAGVDQDAAVSDASTHSDASTDAGSNDSGVVDGGAGDGAADAGDAGPVCGNGDVEGTEGCDDGNTNSGDGCTADCWAVELTQTVSVGPLGLDAVAIADDAYNGTQGSMACVDLVAGAWTGNNITSMTVELGVTHTWIGDLVVKLISPANTVVTLLSRPGYVEPADDGTNAAYGDSSNISNASPITFSQSAVVSAETMGTSLGTNEVACGTDLVCSYLPANGAAAAGDLSAFNGQTSPGTWKLCIGDSGSMDTGSIDAVTLTINH